MIGNARPAADARSINLRRETVPVNKSSKSSFMNPPNVRQTSVCRNPMKSNANDKLTSVGLLLFLRHPHFDAVLFQLRYEYFPDRRVFVFILDQVAAFACARLAQTMRSSAAAERTHEPLAIAAPGRCDITRWVM